MLWYMYADKLGCAVEEVQDLVEYLLKECPHLDLCGLMTIGRQNHLPLQGPNPDFTVSLQDLERVMSSKKCCHDFSASSEV